MKTVDLISEYGNRNINGIDKNDLLQALNDESEIFKVADNRKILHVPSGREIRLDCINNYFNPKKTYYKLNDTDSCQFKQNAFNIYNVEPLQCNLCFKKCLEMNTSIKHNKLLISKNYFTK